MFDWKKKLPFCGCGYGKLSNLLKPFNKSIGSYRIRPNYRTCSYKRTVKQFSNLKDYNQCTFIYFFMKKTYVVGTHLNCFDKSRQFKRVSTTYDSIKKTENNIA